MDLAHFYVTATPEHRRFVNELIAALLVEPDVDAAVVDALSERARGIARVAAAEVCGCGADYRRLAGGGRTGDERLFVAMRKRYERQIERLREVSSVVRDRVARLGRDVQETVRNSGIGRLQQPNLQEYLKNQPKSMQPIPGLESYRRLTEGLSKKLQKAVGPSYFGAIERLSRQNSSDELLGPRSGEIVKRFDQLSPSRRPSSLDPINKYFSRVRRAVPRFDLAALGELIKYAGQVYAAWLERNWAQVFADPEHPPPAMFLLASLPMAVGLPLLRQLKTDDALLLDRLEAALTDGPLIDQFQAAIQRTMELDPFAKRHLVRALESLRDRSYVDVAPPLYQGLERGFRGVAQSRGVIDDRHLFLVEARRAKARSVNDYLEHLDLPPAYLRYLNAWVFGEMGKQARHGELPDEIAYRRWVLRAVAALAGWLEYCANDVSPIAALTARLEGPLHDADSNAASE